MRKCNQKFILSTTSCTYHYVESNYPVSTSESRCFLIKWYYKKVMSYSTIVVIQL